MSTETEIEDDERRSVDLVNEPAITSGAIALFAGVLAMLTSAPFYGVAVPFGVLGVLFLGVGVFSAASRRWVSLGAMSIFVGILIVGALGAATVPMLLISGVMTLVAWDVGQHAITVGEQFGRTVPTRRGELVHAASSTIVGVLGAGASYGVYVLGAGGQPALAVVLLVLGAVGLVWALRD
jgi:hypothetical protein